MHDWHGAFTGLVLIFLLAPALAGGALAYALARRRATGRALAVIGGALAGAGAGAALAVLLVGY